MGTVMIREDTKTRLIKIAAELQQKLGTRVDFDETISFLIEHYSKRKKDWNLFDIFCKPIRNASGNDLYEELIRGRAEDENKYSSD